MVAALLKSMRIVVAVVVLVVVAATIVVAVLLPLLILLLRWLCAARTHLEFEFTFAFSQYFLYPVGKILSGYRG